MRADQHQHPARRLAPVIWGGALILGLFLSLLQVVTAQQTSAREAVLLTIEGPISPATMDYVVRGIQQAEAQDAALVVLKMDTPGGLMDSMREIIKTILGSEVPVATWVAPGGARAASAGTYILYGSHIAAMAPATHLGSATPVQMGGMPGSNESEPAPDGAEPADEGEADSEPVTEPRRGGTPMERKVLEDAVSYIRELAERHGRNAEWAEEAVREAVNLGAREALEKNVIDVVAADLGGLLAAIDGRTVQMASGERVLETAGLSVVRMDPDWRTNLLSVITNPNVAYFLMIIGFYGILFELANPGSLYPGVIGAICLLLALFAFQVLSVNYAGLALILLGLAFIVGEAFMPSFGMLGIGGIVAFVIGSIILMDGSHQKVSLPAVGGTATVVSGFMLWTVYRFFGLRRRPPVSGVEQMLGQQAVALNTFTEERGSYQGQVRLDGERWNAVSDQPVTAGDTLRVLEIEGLTARVSSAKG